MIFCKESVGDNGFLMMVMIQTKDGLLIFRNVINDLFKNSVDFLIDELCLSTNSRTLSCRNYHFAEERSPFFE